MANPKTEYINQLQEYAIQYPNWFWSDKDDAAKARQYLYANDASEVIDTIYEKTPDSIKKNIDPKKLTDNIKSKQFQQGVTDAINKVGHDYVLPAVIALGSGLTAEAAAASGVTNLFKTAGSKAINAIDKTLTKPVSHMIEVTLNPTVAKTTTGALIGTGVLSSGLTESAALLADVYERGKKDPKSVNPTEYAMALLTLTPGLDIPQGQKLNSFVNGLKKTPGAIETLIKDFHGNPKRATAKYRSLFRDFVELKQDNFQTKFRTTVAKNEDVINKFGSISEKKENILDANQYFTSTLKRPAPAYADWLNFKLDNLLGFNYDATKANLAKQRHVLAKNNRRAHRWLEQSGMPEPTNTSIQFYKDVNTPKTEKSNSAYTQIKGHKKWEGDFIWDTPYVSVNETDNPTPIGIDLTFDDWRKKRNRLKVHVFHENTHNIISRLPYKNQISALSDDASYYFPNPYYSDDIANGLQLQKWQPAPDRNFIDLVKDKNGNLIWKTLWINSPEEWVAEYNGLRNTGITDQRRQLMFFKRRFGFDDDKGKKVLDFAKKYSDKYIYNITK